MIATSAFTGSTRVDPCRFSSLALGVLIYRNVAADEVKGETVETF